MISNYVILLDRWSVVIYDSLQTEFMETKHNDFIYRYGAPVFGNTVVYIIIPINGDNQILRKL